MNEQIEEMAKEIYMNSSLSVVEIAENIAEYLYSNGYRKTTDVAREIFDKLEYLSMDGRIPMNGYYYELKKKYESEGAGDD